MNRDAILRRVSQRAANRYGQPPLTQGVLYDLSESGLVIVPEKHGRERNWSAREYRRLLEIIRLNSKGIKNHAEIGLYLWFRYSRDLRINIFEPVNRENISRKFRQNMNDLFRGIHSTYPEAANSSPDGLPAKSVLRKLGDLDSTLAPVVQYQPEELLASYRLIRWGNKSDAGIVASPAFRISNWISHVPRLTMLGIPLMADKKLLVAAIGALAGAMPLPGGGESAAERAIRDATPDQYEMARRRLQFTIRMFRYFSLTKVARSLLEPPWRIAIFVLLLHLDYRASKQDGPSGLLNAQEMDFAEAKKFNKSNT